MGIDCTEKPVGVAASFRPGRRALRGVRSSVKLKEFNYRRRIKVDENGIALGTRKAFVRDARLEFKYRLEEFVVSRSVGAAGLSWSCTVQRGSPMTQLPFGMTP